MDNGNAEGERRAGKTAEDAEEEVEEPGVKVTQLQGLVVELRQGLQEALMELKELHHRDQGLEEQLHAHQTDVEDKIMGLKNSLNTFKEELNEALFHMKDVSSRLRDVQRRMEMLHPDTNKEQTPVTQSRKTSRGEALTASGEEPSLVQHVSSSSLHHSETPQRSCSPMQTLPCELEQQKQCPSKPGAWRDTQRSRETTSTHMETCENQTRRHQAALELLESERLYVSQLSLLLKANISFNGSECVTSKDKRPFPSCLRFLIQQHLQLLQTLQERVLKLQWQGIMGDVFMRLTSKGSDFLGFYLSYLEELPDCVSVVGTLSSGFLESHVAEDEPKPSLHLLLLQPVQRLPEYLLLLQVLLRQTEAEHPDYYLLLVSIQQLRAFTSQHQLLLQHNQELLLSRKEAKRSAVKLLKTVESSSCGSPYPCSSALMEHSQHVKRRKQCLLEQIQSHHYHNQNQAWDPDWEDEARRYGTEWPQQLQFFSHDLKSSGLGSIPESDTPPSRPPGFRHVQPGSALADALGEFLLPPDPSGMENFYEEEVPLQETLLFEHCSSGSSDSSIDIAFVKCPRGPSTSHHATGAITSHDVFGNGKSPGNGFSKLSHRGCISPDDVLMMRHNQHRPLQASQRKSKSLNGLQMESTVSSVDGGPLLEHLHRVGLGSHNKLERQSSKGSRGCPTPSHKLHGSSGNRAEADKLSPDLHVFLCPEGNAQPWNDESKWRGGVEEMGHTPLSERSRKEKSGFRSSFKKLFKKKGSDEKKDKGGENPNIGDQEKNSKLLHLESNRGTAV